jgi:hypothetical protein
MDDDSDWVVLNLNEDSTVSVRFVHLSPVVHQNDWSLVRVPLHREEGIYTVHVGDNYTRTYTDETLPDSIKMRLAMILASHQYVVRDVELLKAELYVNHGPVDLHDIGWQSSDSYFCLVIPKKDLEEMKGDTRSES